MSTFQVSSGKLKVTDPCYSPDTWCTATLDHVKNGTWHASVTRENQGVWGNRISMIEVYHDSQKNRRHRLKYQWRDSNIGVDSGQAGFFDYQTFVNIKINESLDNSFYNEVCELTLGADQFGIKDFYAVSSSGYGDGVYSLYVAEQNGEVVAARIVFIDEDSEDFEEL